MTKKKERHYKPILLPALARVLRLVGERGEDGDCEDVLEVMLEGKSKGVEDMMAELRGEEAEEGEGRRGSNADIFLLRFLFTPA